MDKEKILQSNLLEKYAVGIATKMEEDMVHQALSLFPELKNELEKIELALEQTAFESKIPAPDHVKVNVINEIDLRKKAANVNSGHRPMSPSGTSKYWWAAAAAFLGGVLISGIWSWNNNNNLQKEILSYQSEINKLQEECESDKMLFAFTNDINTEKVSLLNPETGYAALGYWNESEEKGLLQLINLPTIQDNEAYQIWADVEGEMISVGLLENEAYVANNYIDLKYLSDAESINITIEPAGGSDHPNVERLILTANI